MKKFLVLLAAVAVALTGMTSFAEETVPAKAEVDTKWEKAADKDKDGTVEKIEAKRWKKRHHRKHDKDNNPPGPKGGSGTNWENPPGPKGGPGASPNRKK
ncbi:MAG: hypothetical protein A3I09_01675 [Deltaproteobacteria bacterium RIFCSPLOWO2_02_FULL_47_10]|nr:MAG: hypothetical protein A3I09_01675 [Deltaproteobacteria bacterium RIFCSPLOWO2_02_FULL_47_10]